MTGLSVEIRTQGLQEMESFNISYTEWNNS